MDCAAFERIVAELARGAAIDTIRAIEHCSSCRYCSARLTAERVITDQLADIARRLARRSAPPEIEDRLLRLFKLLVP